jgi:hypothetical protein
LQISHGRRILVRGGDPYAGGFGGYVLFGWDRNRGAIQLGGIFSSIVGAI